MTKQGKITEIPQISGRILARNTVYNLFGQGLPLIVAFFTIPLLIRGLGVERFGVLTLTWMVIGYFTLFDLGLSRATTKLVAEALGAGETDKIPQLVWTSFLLLLLLGIIAGVLLAALTPILTGRVLEIQPGMVDEVKVVFYILSLALPVVIVSTMLRGVIEAGQRFDLINMVQIPSGVLTFLLPLVGVHLSLDLKGIVLLLVTAKISTSAVYLHFFRKVVPTFWHGFSFSPAFLRPLFSFGGWMTLSNLVGPFLLYLDRFMIGTLVSVSAVSYYSAPFEVAIRLMIFPTSIIMVLFPAFSALAQTSRETVVRMYTRSMKYLFLLMGPLVLVMILFAHEILKFWLGAEFADKSTLVFQFLLAGMILTPIQVSVSLLHGLGRPDITAKFYLLELLLYVPLIWFLVSRLGIVGAALSWMLRAALDTVLVIIALCKIYDLRFRDFTDNGFFSTILALIALTGALWATSALPLHFQAIVATACLFLFFLVSWQYILDSGDRETLSMGKPR